MILFLMFNFRSEDSMRTYIVSFPEDPGVTIDHLYIKGGAHLAFSQVLKQDSSMIRIGNLHGDRSGMLHTSQEQVITVQDGDVPFPTAVRVYERSEVILPSGEHHDHAVQT